jgi:DNA mismatch repair protein MLH3
MLFQAAPIRPLPPDLVAKIKSSISITRLNGVIVELLKNSLDANAQEVNITVDYQRGGCVVEDDGSGIPAAEFEQNGGLGKAHRTLLGSLSYPHSQSNRFLKI